MITKTTPVFRTWELICLEKLREIGKSSALEWSLALGMGHVNCLRNVISRILKMYPERMKVIYGKHKRYYEAT